MSAAADLSRKAPGGLLDEGLRPGIETFERRVRIGLRLRRIAAVIFTPAGGALSLAAWEMGREDPWMPIFAVLIGLVFLDMAMFHWWRGQFKREVLAPLVPMLDPALRYQGRGCVERETFDSANLFAGRVQRFRGEDLVEGRIDEISIAVCDVEASRMSKRGLLGTRLLASWEPVFKGTFLVADFNKRLTAVTLVLPDNDAMPLRERSKAITRLEGRPLQPVSLEDPEFEREFKVFSQDQVEARYALSPSFMQRLLEFRRQTGRQLLVSLAGSKLYLAIPGGPDRLEPPYPHRIRRLGGVERLREALREKVADYIEELRFGRDVARALDLDTRIWACS